MSKYADMLLARRHTFPVKRSREVAPVSEKALPLLAPGNILQRAALALEFRPAEVVRMPQTPGNRAVGELLGRSSSLRPRIQAKLTVNAPADEYEPEADRTAEKQDISSPAQSQSEALTPPTGEGLPECLKSGIDTLSGISMDSVKVYYNSSQPAQLNALAYAQGSDIHIAPGQEQHLPHEAWHLVQQAQGRVRPTLQLNSGILVNDESDLEKEANHFGARALAIGRGHGRDPHARANPEG